MHIDLIACTHCHEKFAETTEFFYTDKTHKNGLCSWCKACSKGAMRNSQYKCRYGITLDDYNSVLEAQNGRCAICGELPSNHLCIDHDHKTGKVRGLLCISCNVALGWFEKLEVSKDLYNQYLGDNR